MSLCGCGCGGQATISKYTDRRGQIKGMPLRFILGHNSRLSCHPNWKGGRKIRTDGYVGIRIGDTYKPEHVMVAESVFGRSLPPGVLVHHVDENRSNNEPNNLVICQDIAYHKLIHRRLRAYRSCGNADFAKCCYCKRYGDPKLMMGYVNRGRHSWRHRECQNEYARMTRRTKNARLGASTRIQ